MISIKKYAAIDIGSNAMRLLITNVVEQQGKETQFNKSALIRVPIRLGQDALPWVKSLKKTLTEW